MQMWLRELKGTQYVSAHSRKIIVGPVSGKLGARA